MGSFGGREDSVKIFPREATVAMAWVSETASGSSEGVIEVSPALVPGPGIWLNETVLHKTGGVERCPTEIRTRAPLEFAKGRLRVQVG